MSGKYGWQEGGCGKEASVDFREAWRHGDAVCGGILVLTDKPSSTASKVPENIIKSKLCQLCTVIHIMYSQFSHSFELY